MRRTILASALLSFFGVYASSAWAWWDAGHMQIAYVAYKHLDAPVKERVDALLKLNADYSKWTAGAPDEKTAKLYAFVHAATWADDIKRKEYGYTRDNVTARPPARTSATPITTSTPTGISRISTSPPTERRFPRRTRSTSSRPRVSAHSYARAKREAETDW